MHEYSYVCVVGPGTHVGPGVEFVIDLSLFVVPSHASGGSYTYYVTLVADGGFAEWRLNMSAYLRVCD